MKQCRFLVIALALLALAACTPKVVQMNMLAPVKTEGVITALDLYSQKKPEDRGPLFPNAAKMVLIEDPNLAIVVSVYELTELFWAQFDIFNSNDDNYLINQSDFLLLDGNRMAFRKVNPDEAANLFLSKVSGIPPFTYTPKYNYSAYSSTRGYITPQGTLYATTTTTGTIEEDQWNKAGQQLGYAIGAAIIASQNKKLQSIAAVIYQQGLVDDAEIPAKTGAKGGIYWLKPKFWKGPLILRVQSNGKEYQFKQVPKAR